MKIYLGADHRGFKLKEEVKVLLSELGVDYKDMGNEKYDKGDDFPDYAKKVANQVSESKGNNSGILFCGSGGMALVANKFKNVWAVECWNKETAEHSRAYDNANVMTIASDFVSGSEMKKMIKVWLNTKVKKEDKYQRRLNKIKKIENKNFKK